ncbi:ATP13A3 [Cordylochernes scorpioides]|uniref:ATP13A3 n=1 Tax=Cordylochernes scorpioides TaxID=51811 RepID=A0ABY6KAF6_9ARAC|nr:ATP13A3 [Cordylochernes scorpioides]
MSFIWKLQLELFIYAYENQTALRNTVHLTDVVTILHNSNELEQVPSEHLVPGDIIVLPRRGGCIMQCDAVLISGNCIVNESMLTGESVPVTKTPLLYQADDHYQVKEHAKHTLFCGTTLIQTRYLGTELVKAVVIRTGFETAKGELVRSIMFPKPVDFQFNRHIHKFILCLASLASIGFLYTVVLKAMRRVSAGSIALRAFDLITIVIPPALPAAMTIGIVFAQRRLKLHHNIYCISPRSINISGCLSCVCFDKTGTLTEDGLDLWGVVPVAEARLWDWKTRKIRISKDVTFDEKATPHSDRESTKPKEIIFQINSAPDESPVATTNIPVQEMLPVSDISSHPMITRSKVSNSQCNFALADEPSNYIDAITSSDSERWKLAMDEEIDALNKNKTWTLERLADGHKPIGCKWVYKIKTESDGTIQRFKARLVAKGYSQIKNVEYFDTFSPVVRYDSLRILLSHAASERMFLKQFDVKTAFLNGELEELVYLEQPEGYKRDDNSCYRLHKSLYGLRQSSRNWNKKFTNFLYSHNFKTSDADPCIFIGTHNDSNVILALYVDDGIILSKDKEAIAIIMDELEHAFDITSGSVNFFVGLQIEQSEDRASIFIHQSSYIDKILSKFNMADCIPASVPMDPSVILTKQDCPTPEQKEKMPKFPFREAVGSLMFASCVSRPDITYAVSQVSKFLEYPGPAHCTTVKNIFRYLKGTPHMGILFTGQDQLVGYSDSDFARDVDSRKSTTGYAFMMNGGTVSWASQRQPIIALSTTESEYIAACSAAKELIWIRRLLQGIGCDITKETELFIDNQAAIKLVENPVFHKRTKHIDVRYHFIRSKHEEGELKVHHVCSSEQLADIMTKPLPRNKFHYLRGLLNILDREGVFQEPVQEPAVGLQPSSELLVGLASCHSITRIDGVLSGDPLDLKMFEATSWELEECEVEDTLKYELVTPTVVRPASASAGLTEGQVLGLEPPPLEVGIVRQFPFSSSLGRMTVIVRILGAPHFSAFTKGAPETVAPLCLPETVPPDFRLVLQQYTERGLRVLALAGRHLPAGMNYTKLQRAPREDIETGLTFLGLLAMENRLKPETAPVLATLHAAAIRTVMVTGDNLQTAVSVARDCGMIAKHHQVVILETNLAGALTWHYSAHPPATPASPPDGLAIIMEAPSAITHLALTGKTFSHIQEHFPDLLPKIAVRGTVFARMAPQQKQHLVESLQELGYYVAMCGDGANDCGALKAAHAGISLSEAEASVASPFTSKSPNISCVPALIREGRAALVTSFGVLKYMACYSLTQFSSVIILYSLHSNLTDMEFLYIDLFLITVFAAVFGRTEPHPSLSKRPPPSSLMTPTPLVSLLVQVVLVIGWQMAAVVLLWQQPWYEPHGPTDTSDACHDNLAIFSVSVFQYITLAIIFSQGAPYRKPIYTNWSLTLSLAAMTVFSAYLVLWPHPWLAQLLEVFGHSEFARTYDKEIILLAFTQPLTNMRRLLHSVLTCPFLPYIDAVLAYISDDKVGKLVAEELHVANSTLQFRGWMVLLAVGQFVVALFVERILVGKLLFHKWRPRHPPRFQQLEQETKGAPTWLPVPPTPDHILESHKL